MAPFFRFGGCMRLLDAVNLILPKLGEHSVTSLDQRHPTVAVILPEVENRQRVLLGRGWWFNRFEYTAYPDNQGNIVLGQDTLSFEPSTELAALRGLNLFNAETMDFTWDAPVKGVIVQYVEFDDLPNSAAQAVFYDSLISIYSTDIGLTDEIKLWEARAAEAHSDLLAEHLRNVKHSTRNSRRWQRLRNAMRA